MRFFRSRTAHIEVPDPKSRLRKRSVEEHLYGPGPKRILALDGGGVRGIISIQFVKRIEDILRERFGGDADFRLCDYFDMFVGTSTGAIIAAGLAVGRSASDLEKLYLELAPKVFSGSAIRLLWGRSRFDHTHLTRLLKREFGDITLGSPELNTGLAIVSKRVDTDSAWVLTNNRRNPYWDDRVEGSKKVVGNRHYLLSSVVRASTAAPYYFSPELIRVREGNAAESVAPDDGLFLDGGVTTHNNPSFMALQVAALEGHRLKWPLGADKLQIISVGTGGWRRRVDPGTFRKKNVGIQTLDALTGMIAASERNVLLLMQWLARSPSPRVINSEIGDLALDHAGVGPLLMYQRYDVDLEHEFLSSPQIGLQLPESKIRAMQDMSNAGELDLMRLVGSKAAEAFVLDSHFESVFDPLS